MHACCKWARERGDSTLVPVAQLLTLACAGWPLANSVTSPKAPDPEAPVVSQARCLRWGHGMINHWKRALAGALCLILRFHKQGSKRELHSCCRENLCPDRCPEYLRKHLTTSCLSIHLSRFATRSCHTHHCSSHPYITDKYCHHPMHNKTQ